MISSTRSSVPWAIFTKKEKRNSFYSKANGFIFVSNSTRKDFGEFYPELAVRSPTAVIWHGNNFDNANRIEGKKKNQVLFVGSQRRLQKLQGRRGIFPACGIRFDRPEIGRCWPSLNTVNCLLFMTFIKEWTGSHTRMRTNCVKSMQNQWPLCMYPNTKVLECQS